MSGGLRVSGEGTFPEPAVRKSSKERWKAYYEANKETLAAKQSARRIAKYRENIEASRAAERARYAADPRRRETAVESRKRRDAADPVAADLRYANKRMLEKYGRTLADYDRVLAEQNGCCAACNQPPRDVLPTGKIRRLAWDHDHLCCPGINTCGECVRGLICTACNLIIGKIELGQFDTQVAYLEGWRK